MDNFAVYGTQFESLDDEHSAVSKKPTPIQEQVATDERGRRRFHGAFTGGFSAGYFNTVGTKHGWVPQTFTSSKANRAERTDQLAEDYMDEEDLGEFGISTRRIRTKAEFADGGLPSFTTDTRKRLAWEHSTDKVAVSSQIDSFVRPVEARESLGARLLKQMGWKEGKGIGALMSKRQLERQKIHEMKARGFQSEFDEEGVRMFEEVAPDFAFAPEDIPSVYFNSHDGSKGLGYRGLESSSALDQQKGFNTSVLKKTKGGRGIRGQAFGVGVFEDADDDIYTNFDMNQYDFELGQSGKAAEAPKSDVAFVMAETRQKARKFYEAPKMPSGFRANHRPIPVDVKVMPENIKKMGEKLSVVERARYLGDRSASVMQLLPDEERKKLLNRNKKTPTNRKSRWDVQKAEVCAVENLKVLEEAPRSDSLIVPEPLESSTTPFEEDPLKEHRFYQYRQYLRRGLTFPQPIDMSELEWDREVAEFHKYLSKDERDLLQSEDFRKKQVPLAANLSFTAPLAEMLRSKFTSATHEEASSSNRGGKDSDRLAAVKSKMFGTLTRQQFDWYPAKNLCKLFNVPDPFPHSSCQGVLHLQKRQNISSKRVEDVAMLGVGLPNTLNELKSKQASSIRTKHQAVSQMKSEETEKTSALEENDSEDELFDVDGDDDSAVEAPSLDLLKAIFGGSEDEEEPEDLQNESQAPDVPEKSSSSRRHTSSDSETEAARPRSSSPNVETSTNENDKNSESQQKFLTVMDLRELDEEFGPRPPSVIDSGDEGERGAQSSKSTSKVHKKDKKHRKHKKNKKEKKTKKEKKRRRSHSRSSTSSYESR